MTTTQSSIHHIRAVMVSASPVLEGQPTSMQTETGGLAAKRAGGGRASPSTVKQSVLSSSSSFPPVLARYRAHDSYFYTAAIGLSRAAISTTLTGWCPLHFQNPEGPRITSYETGMLATLAPGGNVLLARHAASCINRISPLSWMLWFLSCLYAVAYRSWCIGCLRDTQRGAIGYHPRAYRLSVSVVSLSTSAASAGERDSGDQRDGQASSFFAPTSVRPTTHRHAFICSWNAGKAENDRTDNLALLADALGACSSSAPVHGTVFDNAQAPKRTERQKKGTVKMSPWSRCYSWPSAADS
ncbi:hypothetical protein QBC44DRAFT_404678 [Cladorrhinum sp. PSN332]|nr:hypothetical protein QBC44DRAFT_404678 [Cladorrhinum sp. PSN332]